MYRNLLLLFFALIPFFSTYAQVFRGDLVHSLRTSPYTYVYRLSDREARDIYRESRAVVNETYFHTVVDSFPTGKEYDEKRLPPGHYLLTHADGGQLSYQLRSVSPLSVKVLNNQVDLAVWVADTLGRSLSDATVKLKSRKITFDPLTQTYRLRKTNRRGILSVMHRGFTSYHPLETRNRSSWVSKTGRKIYWYSGIGYVLKPFRDMYASIRHHRPTGWLSSVSRKFKGTDYSEWKDKGYLVFNKPMYQPGDTV